jgi:hypothetical protein
MARSVDDNLNVTGSLFWKIARISAPYPGAAVADGISDGRILPRKVYTRPLKKTTRLAPAMSKSRADGASDVFVCSICGRVFG